MDECRCRLCAFSPSFVKVVAERDADFGHFNEARDPILEVDHHTTGEPVRELDAEKIREPHFLLVLIVCRPPGLSPLVSAWAGTSFVAFRPCALAIIPMPMSCCA
jgi:hypothetical protein